MKKLIILLFSILAYTNIQAQSNDVLIYDMSDTELYYGDELTFTTNVSPSSNFRGFYSIQLSSDNGVTYNTVVDSLFGYEPMSRLKLEFLSNACILRAIDVRDSSVLGYSDNFNVSAGTITIDDELDVVYYREPFVVYFNKLNTTDTVDVYVHNGTNLELIESTDNDYFVYRVSEYTNDITFTITAKGNPNVIFYNGNQIEVLFGHINDMGAPETQYLNRRYLITWTEPKNVSVVDIYFIDRRGNFTLLEKNYDATSQEYLFETDDYKYLGRRNRIALYYGDTNRYRLAITNSFDVFEIEPYLNIQYIDDVQIDDPFNVYWNYEGFNTTRLQIDLKIGSDIEKTYTDNIDINQGKYFLSPIEVESDSVQVIIRDWLTKEELATSNIFRTYELPCQDTIFIETIDTVTVTVVERDTIEIVNETIITVVKDVATNVEYEVVNNLDNIDNIDIVNGMIYLNRNDITNSYIYNLNGEKLYEDTHITPNFKSIDVSGYITGVYILYFFTENQLFIQKFIVE